VIPMPDNLEAQALACALNKIREYANKVYICRNEMVRLLKYRVLYMLQ